MQAVVYTQYGPPDVLQLRDIPTPIPTDHQILVKIHATTVTPGDWRMRKADPFLARLYNGLLRPKRVTILGFEFAGQIQTIGSRVTQFKPGDRIFGHNGFHFGGYAQYLALPQTALLAPIPDPVTYEQAAPLPIGATAPHNHLKQGNITPGQHVLIYGASGSVGTYAVQLAKLTNTTVTAVSSAPNHPLLKTLGADHVIDYKTQDITTQPQRYDLIYDAVGEPISKIPPHKFKPLLTPNGKYIHVGMNRQDTPADLTYLVQLVAAGKLTTVIDRRYPLSQIVDAHRYVEQKHKKGNVIITIPP